MIRFVPDDLLEGLLRPLLMMDPVAGVYFEGHAPDMRWAAVLLLGLTAWASRRTAPAWTLPQQLAGAGLITGLYLWTWAVGNGRYFGWGLLLVGPMAAAAASWQPARRWRLLALAAVLGLQALVLRESFRSDMWGLTRWQGREPAVEPSPLREQPAVFFTISSISYSALVPHFHPQSRWANVAGQHQITPDRPEYARLQRLLSSPLPAYVLVPSAPVLGPEDRQPSPELKQLMGVSLAPHGLEPSEADCSLLRSRLTPGPPQTDTTRPTQRGFWVCPVVKATRSVGADTYAAMAQRHADVFAQLERRCPRFFPPGTGRYANLDGVASRGYLSTDMRVYVEDQGRVLIKHFRALNPTPIGPIDEVRAGRFTFDCHKVPGRYVYPWNRD